MLNVYNLLGEEVVTLVEGHLSAGEYEYCWNVKDLPSGMYLSRLEFGGFSKTIKLVLQR